MVRRIVLGVAWLVLSGCVPMANEPAAAQGALGAPPSSTESIHEGYYYPSISSREVYHARARPLGDSDRTRRLGFVTLMLGQQLDLHYPPQHILFAKGDDAEKMIILGFGDSFATLYRARAVMAGMTALVRDTALFQELQVDDLFTFYDLATMLGFKEIVLSNGSSYAHRVSLEQ
jgi:hypothetical protein